MKYLICISFISLVIACSDSNIGNQEKASLSQPIPEFVFKDLEQESESCLLSPENCLTIWIQYPYFVQQKGIDHDYLNQQVLSLLLGDSAEGLKSPEDLANWYMQEHQQTLKASSITAEWQINKEITPTFIHAQVVSLKLESFEFTGGAHGNGLVLYQNLQVLNQKSLQLADIMVSNYQKRLNDLAEIAFRKSRELNLNDDLAAAGFEFGAQGFEVNQNYGLTPIGIEFVFNAYEVASYAMGTSQFTITWDELLQQNLLNKEWKEIITKELQDYHHETSPLSLKY